MPCLREKLTLIDVEIGKSHALRQKNMDIWF